VSTLSSSETSLFFCGPINFPAVRVINFICCL
jgi:hypothetical protein